MQAPWRNLKETEMEALRQRRNGSPLPGTLSRLRKLVTKCGQDADAEARICYHGSLALLFEYDRDWSNALKHRQLEIRKIRRLHELEQQNPTGGYATQNYEDKDFRERREILEQIKRKTITEQDAPPNRRPARQRAVRTPRKGGGR